MYAALKTRKQTDPSAEFTPLLNYIGVPIREVYALITILLRGTGVILDSDQMVDGVGNAFVS